MFVCVKSYNLQHRFLICCEKKTLLNGWQATISFIDLSDNKLLESFQKSWEAWRTLQFCCSTKTTMVRYLWASADCLHWQTWCCLVTCLPAHCHCSSVSMHSPALSYVSVNNNKLTGEIPKWLCAGGQLQHFSASSSQLSGEGANILG